MHSIWTSLHGLCTADIIYVCAAMAAVKYVKKSADKGYVHQFHIFEAMARHVKYLNHVLMKQHANSKHTLTFEA